MKGRSNYLIVIIFLVIYLAKGVATVMPLATNTSKSVAWVLPDDYESEDKTPKNQNIEEEIKTVYLNDGLTVILPYLNGLITQKFLRENKLHYQSISFSPSTPPPESV